MFRATRKENEQRNDDSELRRKMRRCDGGQGRKLYVGVGSMGVVIESGIIVCIIAAKTNGQTNNKREEDEEPKKKKL